MTKVRKSKVTAKPVDTEEKKDEIKDEGILDMVIAFDTTGSMSAYIGSVKTHVRELVPELFKTNPNLQISVVAFGDYCDMETKDEFGKAYQSLDLTRNENDVIDFVNKAKDTGGGDGDEFYELVLKKIVEETNWRENSKKSILFIADADPHQVGYTCEPYVINNQIDWRVEAQKAIDKGIQIDTLSLSYKGDNCWYRELSQMTNGVYAPFKSNGKTDELIKAAAWSRGGDATKDLYIANVVNYCSAKSDLFDAELGMTYKAFAANRADLDASSIKVDTVSESKVSDSISDAISSIDMDGVVLGGSYISTDDCELLKHIEDLKIID